LKLWKTVRHITEWGPNRHSDGSHWFLLKLRTPKVVVLAFLFHVREFRRRISGLGRFSCVYPGALLRFWIKIRRSPLSLRPHSQVDVTFDVSRLSNSESYVQWLVTWPQEPISMSCRSAEFVSFA
jgi:hypothetical protein